MSVSPTKRSMRDLKSIASNKCTNTRKLVYVQAGATGDGTIGFIKAKIEGSIEREPFTNPARVAILSTAGTNELVEGGFFMIASMITNEAFDTPLRTSRGFDYKLFLASVDDLLTEDEFLGLKNLALRFCDVSRIGKQLQFRK